MSVPTIDRNSRVLVHFSILLADGTVADDTRKGDRPVLFLMSSDLISEGIKNQLMGLTVGAKKRFTLVADDAFGPSNPDNIHFFDSHQFPNDIKLEVGTVVAFTQPSGEEMPGLILAVEDGSVKVDFNHPLAGKTVTFDLDVIDIK